MAPAEDPVDAVVLIGAPGLAWSDIDPATTPVLHAIAEEGLVGSMTVRSVRTRSCAVDGWLTLSAGRRAADLPGPCRDPLPVGADGVVPRWSDYTEAAGRDPYDAQPGTLGSSLAAAGRCAASVGPGAAIAVADRAGRVEHHAARLPAPPACPVLVVDGGTLPAGPPARAGALRELDALVDRVVRSAGPNTRVLVAGVGDGDSPVRPRAVLMTAPRPGVLLSPSTRQPGLVQLQDLTAFLVDRFGTPVPGLTGRPLEWEYSPVGAAAGPRLADRVGLERQAATMRAVAPQVTGWLAALVTAWALAAAGLRWRRRGWPARLRVGGVVIAAVPVSTFLANLLPWERLAAPGWAFAGSLALATAVVAGVALAVGRRVELGALRAVALVTVLVLGGDVVTGSTLQLASVFGQNPTVGGRFYGLGNTSFALYGLAVLVLVQWVATSARGGRWRLPVGALVLLAALALEAHPSFGADFGGPPGLLLGGLVVLAAEAGLRLTPVRVALALVLAAALTTGVAVADWLRPPQARTHLGEFVQTVLDGGAGEVVTRKLAQNLDNLASPPLLAIAVATVVLTAVLARSGWRPTAAGTIVVRGALVLAAVGFAVNDSGLVIPAYVAVVLVPLLLADRPCAGGQEVRWRPGGGPVSRSSSSAPSPSGPTPGT